MGASGKTQSWGPDICERVRDQPPCTGESGDTSAGASPGSGKQSSQVGRRYKVGRGEGGSHGGKRNLDS